MGVDDGEGRVMICLKGAMRLLKGKDTGEDKQFCCACGGRASASVGGGQGMASRAGQEGQWRG